MYESVFDFNIWFWFCIALLIRIVYDCATKPEISVKKALKLLKKSLIRMIVFYQGNYSDPDQIVLIKKWLDSIDKNNIPPEQMKLFKDYIKKM